MVNSKKRMHRGALRTGSEITALETQRAAAYAAFSDRSAHEPTAAEIIDAVERGMRDSAPRATRNASLRSELENVLRMLDGSVGEDKRDACVNCILEAARKLRSVLDSNF
jgi:hypothetical protein